MNRMERYIKKTVKRRLKDDSEYVKDLLTHGCQNGFEIGMIYYDDTIAFFKRYKKEINTLLAKTISDTGCSLDQLFKDWDKTDPLALDIPNQNLLAWFAWEETVYRLFGEKYGF